jgi:hypothetical protein
MQASKIKVNSVYAYRDKSGELKRFTVSAVVTRRVNNYGNPHDYTSQVEGVIEHTNGRVISVPPEAVLGPFDDYKELVERRAREQAAAEAKKQAAEQAARDLGELLYKITGTIPPTDKGYGAPFRVSWNDVSINEKGVPLLLAYLKERV